MPVSHLAFIDWMVIGAYFLALVVIGLYYRRFATRSVEDYYLSGRRNSGWSNGVSYAAALMNADVAPAYSGLAVATGVFVCWFYLSRFGIALFVGEMPITCGSGDSQPCSYWLLRCWSPTASS